MKELQKAILKCCDSSDPRFLAYRHPELNLPLAEKLRFLSPMKPAKDFDCRECNGWGKSSVVSFDEKDGSVSFYMSCSECGVTRLDPSELKRWTVNVETLMNRFTSVAGIQGQIATVIPQQLWHLGRIGNHPYIYARYSGEREFKALLPGLQQFPKATIVTASEYLAARLQRILPNRCIALELSATFLEDGSLSLDESLFEDTQSESTPKPRKRRGERAAKIELLEQAMKDHVVAAYDYLQDTANRGEIKLLPRPSQELLAKMTQMQQPDVSRCMNDPEGKILRLIWEKSQTLDGIHELARMFARK